MISRGRLIAAGWLNTMDAIALHTELRNVLSLADELGRHEHALGKQTVAAQLAALRTTIAELEREAGRTHSYVHIPSPVLVAQLERSLATIRDRAEEIPMQLRPRIVMLMEGVERIIFASLQPASTIPAKPLLGVLPLARVIPQDVHSIGDYLVSAAYFASAIVARTSRGRAVGVLLGAVHGGVSLATDMKLSLAKIIPIETHEVMDHASGVKACASPLALGYLRKDPIASAIQIVAGLGTIALSLFTDYRAERGVGLARRSKGGPAPHRRTAREARKLQNRVSEVQRPLEGLSGPSYIPSILIADGGSAARRPA